MKFVYSQELLDNQECKDNIRNLLEFISEKPNGKAYIYDLVKEFAIQNNDLYIHSNLVDLLNRIYQEERGPIFQTEINGVFESA